MAAGILPKVGTEFGPCLATCSHLDCATTREMAETRCRICPDAIGYETGFFIESDPGVRPRVLVHELCAMLEVEEERKR